MLYSLFFILKANTVKALEPTQTSTPSATTLDKLKSLRDELASKSAKYIPEVLKKLQNKAYIGFIKSKSDTAITIATDKGTKMVSVSDGTLVSGNSKTKTKITFKDLNVNDYLAALGDIDDNEVLIAKKLVKISPPKTEEEQTVYGSIVSLGDNIVTLQTKQNQTVSLTIDEDTSYQTFKSQEASLRDLKIGKTIIAAGTKSSNGILKTKFVYIATYSPVIKPKLATPSASAQPTIASPSGSKKKK